MIAYLRKLFVAPTVEQRAAEAVEKARHDLLTVELEIARLQAYAVGYRNVIDAHGSHRAQAVTLQSVGQQRGN